MTLPGGIRGSGKSSHLITDEWRNWYKCNYIIREEGPMLDHGQVGSRGWEGAKEAHSDDW